MNHNKHPNNYMQAGQLDMVSYLATLGFGPKKIRGNDYWYLSPLRSEHTPSFKINRQRNCWFDHGTGKGGYLIDFAIEYHHCTIAEWLGQLQRHTMPPNNDWPAAAVTPAAGNIRVLEACSIRSWALLNYLWQRNIPCAIAASFCKEIRYELNGKKYFSIGFKNDEGGYELRNPYCKNSSSPKAITTFKKSLSTCAVFEGFFDFLSFQFLFQHEAQLDWSFCILNSLAFFTPAQSFLRQFSTIHLFLDNDKAGQKCSAGAVQNDSRFIDNSHLYKGYKDLNDWTMGMGKKTLELSITTIATTDNARQPGKTDMDSPR